MSTDYSHEQAAVTAYATGRVLGLFRANAAAHLTHDNLYFMQAARGELSGLPPTSRTALYSERGRDSRDITTKLFQSSMLGNSKNYSGPSYGLTDLKLLTEPSSSSNTDYSGTKNKASTNNYGGAPLYS